MRRSRTTSMTAASEGVSRHQQTCMVQTEEDKQTRRHHSHHHGTHHYPTIPGDRVHFDTLEPYAAKLHQQLQHELKSELGGRRRSRSVTITSRERSIERSTRAQRHRHNRQNRDNRANGRHYCNDRQNCEATRAIIAEMAITGTIVTRRLRQLSP